MDEKTKDLAELKQDLIHYLDSALTSGGIEHILGCDLAVITDAIKDLAEAEEECYEALYYKTVVEAMHEEEENGEERYYRPNRRMGYRPPYYNDTTEPYFANAWRMEPPRDIDADRYGRAFSEYRKARRNYTETHAKTDHNDMELMAQRHLSNTIDTVKEMWADADPEMKSRIKSDLTQLVSTMNV